MAKDKREALLRDGEHRLQEWQAGATPAELSSFIGRDAAADLAIAARLGGIADAASVVALQALDAATNDKLVHKEVKRALYRLEMRGIEVPHAPAPAPVSLGAAAPLLEGYLSPVDGNGDQLVWLVRADANGVLHLFGVVNEADGLKDLGLFETSRKSLRAARAEMAEQHGIRMVEADWRYCDCLIDRAFRRSRQRGEVIGDLPGMRRRLTDMPVTEVPAPIRGIFDADEVRADSAALERSALLLGEPEVRSWVFSYQALVPYLEEWQGILESPIVISEEQQQERFQALGEKAVHELFGGDAQAAWVRRLEEMAYVLHASGRSEAGRAAFAAALALEVSPRGGVGVPICDNLGRSCLAAYVQAYANQAKDEAEADALVTPQE